MTSRPPRGDVQHIAFGDAASGIAASGDGDRFAFSVGHDEDGIVIIDYTQEWKPPFRASDVVDEIAILMRAYSVGELITDGFSSGFVRSELARHGLGHKISDHDKSGCYLASLPMFTSRRVRLPDLPFIVDQFAALERRTGSGGRDHVDAKGHEDSANTIAGVIAALSAAKPMAHAGIFGFYQKQAQAITLNTAIGTAQAITKRPAGWVKMTLVDGGPTYTSPLGEVYTTETEGDRTVCWLRLECAQIALGPYAPPALHQANRELQRRLGKPREVNVRDLLAYLDDQQPEDPRDKMAITRRTFRMIGRPL